MEFNLTHQCSLLVNPFCADPPNTDMMSHIHTSAPVLELLRVIGVSKIPSQLCDQVWMLSMLTQSSTLRCLELLMGAVGDLREQSMPLQHWSRLTSLIPPICWIASFIKQHHYIWWFSWESPTFLFRTKCIDDISWVPNHNKTTLISFTWS